MALFLSPMFALAEDRTSPPQESPTEITEPTSTQSADPRDGTTAASTEIPSAVSLFFRDIGQRIQLIFTFDPVRDAAKRIAFAEDNLKLAQMIMAATDDRNLEDRAQGLANRADVLSQSVLDNWEKWSRGEAEAVSALTVSVTEYFSSAEALVNVIASTTNDDAIKTDLLKTASSLAAQKKAVADAIAAKVPTPTIMLDASASSTIIRLPTNPDNDNDRDGILDEQEADLGTSTKNFDSDGDGLSDRAEIEKYGTDPTKDDTDGDGFRDGLEVLKGYNPRGSGAQGTAKIDPAGLTFITVLKAKPSLDVKTLQYLDSVLKNYQLTTSTK